MPVSKRIVRVGGLLKKGGNKAYLEAAQHLNRLALFADKNSPRQNRALCRLAFRAWSGTVDLKRSNDPCEVERPIGHRGFFSVGKKGLEGAHENVVLSLQQLLLSGFSHSELAAAAKGHGLRGTYADVLRRVAWDKSKTLPQKK